MREIKSFKHAIRGIGQFLKTSGHGRFHLLAALLVIGLGVYVQVSRTEWMGLLLCMGLVLGLEALNSSIEALCDKVSPERSEEIRNVKDMAAGAVLIAALAAMIIGVLIFWPYLF